MADRLIAGRYRLDRLAGTGAMSEVWAAEDLELGRTVAVKLRAADADAERFDREAHAAAALSHPNICAIYDYGTADGRRFIVLEYLPGGSLEDRLRSGEPLPDDETQLIADEIAAGLAHAHARGVVHRDLKPANILFDAQGRAKIADFGIARMDGSAGLTAVGAVLGTAAYISPEQVEGLEATPASDVYSFGVILFRMLTGRLPFESPDALATAAMHRDLRPPSVLDFRPEAPAVLESVAAAALAKSPLDRPADGLALVDQLGHPRPGETAVTQVVTPPRRSRRGRTALVVAVVVLAAAGVGLAMAVTLGNGTTTPLPSTTTDSTTRATTGSASEPLDTETAATTTSVVPATTAPSTTTTAAATTVPPPTTAPATATTAPTTTAPPPTTATSATTTAPATTATTTPITTTTSETTATTATTSAATTAAQTTVTTMPG